jgi:hypothetical protein
LQKSDPELITDPDSDPNLQIISDPSGSGCATLPTIPVNGQVLIVTIKVKFCRFIEIKFQGRTASVDVELGTASLLSGLSLEPLLGFLMLLRIATYGRTSIYRKTCIIVVFTTLTSTNFLSLLFSFYLHTGVIKKSYA